MTLYRKKRVMKRNFTYPMSLPGYKEYLGQVSYQLVQTCGRLRDSNKQTKQTSVQTLNKVMILAVTCQNFHFFKRAHYYFPKLNQMDR